MKTPGYYDKLSLNEGVTDVEKRSQVVITDNSRLASNCETHALLLLCVSVLKKYMGTADAVPVFHKNERQ